MTHDFRASSDPDASVKFRAWLESETTGGLQRAYGHAEATKAVIFLFVNRAFESHMPEEMIAETFDTCLAHAGYSEQDEDAALSWLEAFAELARGVYGGA